MKLRPLTPPQRRAVIDATNAPLIGYRRGYAHTKAGPFHSHRTVQSLRKQGALRRMHPWNVNRVTAWASDA